MNREDSFIRHFESSSLVGDDAAILNNMCVSQDAFFEGVHFKRGWMSLYDIGKKAMLVNLSDAVAMNATPRYALLTVAMPKDMTRREMAELARGLRETAEAFGVEIIGGDTLANPKLDLSVTILAECERPLRRTGLKEGDLLAYTGKLGTSRRDLQRLLRGGGVSPVSRFLHPVLRQAFVAKAARYLRVGMDISDGLFHDLEKLHRANRLGFDFFAPIPKRVGCSGEEYEMLVAFDARHEKAVRRIAAQTRTPLTIFAKAARKPYRNVCRAHHF
ncbi:thiamine-phosphate kinase [Hydrogenimonas sp.]